jgi:DNA-binding NarL/FixJ family response regulator
MVGKVLLDWKLSFNEPLAIWKYHYEFIEQLTVWEKDIVNGILDGLSYKLIADKYNIAIDTVDTVRMNVKKVYRKLNINSKSELFKMMGNN